MTETQNTDYKVSIQKIPSNLEATKQVTEGQSCLPTILNDLALDDHQTETEVAAPAAYPTSPFFLEEGQIMNLEDEASVLLPVKAQRHCTHHPICAGHKSTTVVHKFKTQAAKGSEKL